MPEARSDFAFASEKMETYKGKARFYNITRLKEMGHNIDGLPYSIRVLLENTLRHAERVDGANEAVHRLLEWPKSIDSELPFMPYRVLLQDYTGVPLVVDLTAMRSAMKRIGKDPLRVNSKVPVDLVIDHSVQVDSWGNSLAFFANIEKEYERNGERYALLKWAQDSFPGMRIFPPGKGICHQVNLEYLATVATATEQNGELTALPDTLIGTDSHTTMVNGVGVLGWGVGGTEAEAVMLGEPYHMPAPKVVGVRLKGALPEGSTPTDLVLAVTELLRSKDVVSAFVEYFGDGYAHLSVPDRATLGNMSPEYGATMGFSPVDSSTLSYLTQTGRDPAHVSFVENFCKLEGLFVLPDAPEPKYSEILEVDLSKIEPAIAGPRNPEERKLLRSVPAFMRSFIEERKKLRSPAFNPAKIHDNGFNFSQTGDQVLVQEAGRQTIEDPLADGSIIIAAITSCTNTSNPTVMMGAGLLAKNAVMKGLTTKSYVKCSLAPGSSVVKDYLEGAGLLFYLDKLGFNLVGYGCTTCIGNSGPLAPEIEEEIKAKDLYAVAVLSGNRNFDGRIHPLARGSFLMSPMLVVAYALVGRMDFDFSLPLGSGADGKPVYLRDVWPTLKDVKDTIVRSVNSDLYKTRYANALVGDDKWLSLSSSSGDTFAWKESSTYIREPPWFETDRVSRGDISGARVLALMEDKVTTDHISPAGTIQVDSPAGKYLVEHGVQMIEFSTYGSRRGNHEVMVRGGFSNIRLKNLLADGKEGGYTKYLPTGEILPIFDAAQRYISDGTPLIVLAGKQYGTGSSRDWAAKATMLLGVRAVIAESFERIHRSNLVAMGVLPLEFSKGESSKTLDLKGDEVYAIEGLHELKPGAILSLTASSNGRVIKFRAKARIDNKAEMSYYNSGGVLPYVFRLFS